jgi:hypothetical protein
VTKNRPAGRLSLGLCTTLRSADGEEGTIPQANRCANELHRGQRYASAMRDANALRLLSGAERKLVCAGSAGCKPHPTRDVRKGDGARLVRPRAAAKMPSTSTGRCPQSGAPSASQSTIDCLENAPRETEAAHLAAAPVDWARVRPREQEVLHPPRRDTLKEEDPHAVEALTRAGGSDDVQQSRSVMRSYTLVHAAGLTSSVNTLKLDS